MEAFAINEIRVAELAAMKPVSPESALGCRLFPRFEDPLLGGRGLTLLLEETFST